MSFIVQPSILQRASSVFVETESPAFSLRMVELLMFPLTWSVYVVALRSCIVSHSGAYEIKKFPTFPPLHISIIAYNGGRAL